MAWLCCRNTVGARWPISPRGRQIISSTMASAEHQHAVLVEAAEQLEAADHGERGERDAELRAHAAEHDDREHQRQFLEGEGFRADETLPRREERAGKAAEHGAGRERRQLGRGGVDAERAAGDLVLAQRFPGAPDRQPAQPDRHPVGEQRQRQDQVEQEHDAVGRREFDAEFGREPVIARRSAECRTGSVAGMPETPFGPPVRLCQLMMTRRMISPNASVTMAR